MTHDTNDPCRMDKNAQLPLHLLLLAPMHFYKGYLVQDCQMIFIFIL